MFFKDIFDRIMGLILSYFQSRFIWQLMENII